MPDAGCYAGCFYYSDSCFRQDCKRKKALAVNTGELVATPMPLFPVMNSLQEVVQLGNSKLPIKTRNELLSVLMTYHNTLLKVQGPKN